MRMGHERTFGTSYTCEMPHISYLRGSVVLFFSALMMASCKEPSPVGRGGSAPSAPVDTAAQPTSAAAQTAAAPKSDATDAPKPAPSPAQAAEIGKPAPEFELKDLDGKAVKLGSFRGKVVVLEWFNAGCPFVKAAHLKGSLKTAAKDAKAKGVVWLAVSSSADGKQGAGIDANREGVAKFGLDHPVLLDPTGSVGHMYGATNTPHLFVVDEGGTLVYRGAVDNSPDGEGESPTGGKLVSYVTATLADLASKRPVAVPTTRAYGCGVKYAH